MANKIICDKCGKELDYNTAYSSTTVYPREGKDKSCRYDLCSECATKLAELITHFVERKDIKINDNNEHEILHKFMTNEWEKITNTEMVSIPVEQYDSLNRMIAHYDNDNNELWKAVHDISVRIAKLCCTKGGENKNE